MPQSNNNTYSVLTNNELIELNAYELEEMLGNHPDSIFADVLAEDPFNIAADYNLNATGTEVNIVEEVLQNEVKVPTDAGTFEEVKEEPENVLVITIPEPLQEAAVFSKFPTVPLDENVLGKINKAAAGFDGAFLKFGKQTSKKSLSPIRRPPLQVIQQYVNVSKPKPVKQTVSTSSAKRKQNFKLTREDGISFVEESSSLKKESKRQRRTPKRYEKEKFVWASTTDEETDKASEASDEPTRCPGCLKVFKKISQHKCKKIQQTETSTDNFICEVCKKSFFTKEELNAHAVSHTVFICLGCKEEFKTKRSLTMHLKNCDASKSIFKTPSMPKQQKIVKQIKRQTRSSAPKQH